jgi:ferredoxin-NADP reductase/truncated hemoglobin YjbI
MTRITFEEISYTLVDGETLLDGLLRQGQELPFSCRHGSCHVCMMRATEGMPPLDAQIGISERLARKNYFLPCRCYPEEDMSIDHPRKADLTCQAVVQEKEMLSEDVCRIALEPAVNLYYHAGQFINIRRDERQIRSYSLASVPHQDYFLELHVRRHPQGEVSRWLVDDVAVGDELEIVQPQGDCYYKADSRDTMVLACTGTGLAPVIGIARDALYTGHSGPVWLYRGTSDERDLYADHLLDSLTSQFGNLHIETCIRSERSIEEAIRNQFEDLSDCWIHLAGNPKMVQECGHFVRSFGAQDDRILSDPFDLREPLGAVSAEADTNVDGTEQHNLHPQETPYPPPTPELWDALERGKKLASILDDFYDRVFEDPLLSPYFHNSTKQRAKEKVYSFYRRLFSGDRGYFGDRPRNAHHWMVISDRIFDYRENLLKKCMEEHGLSPEMIQRWQRLEELYRKDIVKDKPRGRLIDGVETPADGYGQEILSIAGVCDGCEQEIPEGSRVSYHLRTGKVYCGTCMPSVAPKPG